MEFLSHYGMFLLETFTLVIAILIVVAGVVAIASKGKAKEKQKISIKKLNEHYQKLEDDLKQEVLTKEGYKKWQKSIKKQEKQKKKQKLSKSKVYVLKFHGDIQASQVKHLTEEINCIITTANGDDEVLINIESGGGVVHGYGLAASQLERLKQKNIPITACVDKVAASGGYLMAAVANKIIAAPFAIIGSIGVIAQLPNFNKLLKKNDIEFEQITAGEFKRTLTVFGENTDKARQKMHEDIQEIHDLFKDHVSHFRPQMDINRVATGEYWLGKRAFELKLVDDLITFDDYLLNASKDKDLYLIKHEKKKSMIEKMTQGMQVALAKFGIGQAAPSIEENLWFK